MGVDNEFGTETQNGFRLKHRVFVRDGSPTVRRGDGTAAVVGRPGQTISMEQATQAGLIPKKKPAKKAPAKKAPAKKKAKK